MPTQNTPFSARRLIGAGFFGVLVGAYVVKACDFAIPSIISIAYGLPEPAASDQYLSSSSFPFLKIALGAMLGSGVAAFLARRFGVLAGFLATSPYALLLLAMLASDPTGFVGGMRVGVYAPLALGTVVLASLAGGLTGQRLYLPRNDPDLDQAKLTVFGIYWAHYFWIFPLVLYPYLASVMMAAYASVMVFLADFYLAFHPSIWFSFRWWLMGMVLNPLELICSFWLIRRGAERFWRVIAFGVDRRGKLSRLLRILLYGLCAPSLAFFAAAISATSTRALPRVAAGDWKLYLALLAGLVALGFAAQIWSWIKEKSRCGA